MEIGLLVLTIGLLLFLILRKQGSNGMTVELRELIKGEFYQNREELTKNFTKEYQILLKKLKRMRQNVSYLEKMTI